MSYFGAGGNRFMKKTRSKKSRDTVPFKSHRKMKHSDQIVRKEDGYQ